MVLWKDVFKYCLDCSSVFFTFLHHTSCIFLRDNWPQNQNTYFLLFPGVIFIYLDHGIPTISRARATSRKESNMEGNFFTSVYSFLTNKCFPQEAVYMYLWAGWGGNWQPQNETQKSFYGISLPSLNCSAALTVHLNAAHCRASPFFLSFFLFPATLSAFLPWAEDLITLSVQNKDISISLCLPAVHVRLTVVWRGIFVDIVHRDVCLLPNIMKWMALDLWCF